MVFYGFVFEHQDMLLFMQLEKILQRNSSYQPITDTAFLFCFDIKNFKKDLVFVTLFLREYQVTM